MRKKYLSKYIDLEFFEYPTNHFKNKYYGLKYAMLPGYEQFLNPYIIICNKGSKLDKYFVSGRIISNFVFLKDDVVFKFYTNQIDEETKKLLLEDFKILKQANVSVVVFPEKDYQIFGKCSKICESLTEFLVETKFDIRFLNIIGSYFTYPVWSEIPRRYEIKFTQQFSLKNTQLNKLSKQDRNDAINNYLPSSADTYAYKFPAIIHSNKIAENFSTIVYFCPNCKKMFSLYSEFNCLKCNNCNTAIELNKYAQIDLCKKFNTYSDVDDFMFNSLKVQSFTIKPLITYNKINVLIPMLVGKPHDIGEFSAKIYADKIVLTRYSLKYEIDLKNVIDTQLDYDNMLKITEKDRTLILKGNNKENLYIIHDLVKINK